jgi:chromosome segregation protein
MPSRLKSLELHGYKTFAARTEFVFSPNITAIVGPNGSGKSNVADSLRWVLGEQSYSLLRGKKTEDMIFAGSEGRPRAGMASASVTFDNSDGWLPIDFSEVAITRRAYRDGQNEYLINGQRVRLKDVSELLAQSGLAERTYTIIGQGLVDAALMLKAEERRRLFEEAAGIGLHRARREEALNRLETTHRNLERVEDILAELQPRLRSLERQARRAQEYDQVKADLQVLLREWYGFHWRRAQSELTGGLAAAQVQEAALSAARARAAALGEKVDAARARTAALRADLNAWHRQEATLHTRREGLSRELAVAAEKQRALTQEQTQTEARAAVAAEELSGLRQALTEVEADLTRLAAEGAEAKTAIAAARRALEARQAERSRAERQVASARQTLGGLTARQTQIQARQSERRAQIERSRQTLQTAEGAVTQAEEEISRAQARLAAAERDAAAAAEARQHAEAAERTARQTLATLETQRKDLQDQRSTLAGKQARLEAEQSVLENAEKALTGHEAGTRTLVQAGRQGQLAGVRGALNTILDAPPELATALAAALGESLDAVLLDAETLDAETQAALDLLQRQGQRGALLPLRSLTPPPPLTPPAASLGLAADLVQSAPEYRPVIDLLFGATVIVSDRPAAARILAAWRAAPAAVPSHARVVTLAGEVFTAAGPIFSGGGAASAGAGMLSRTRQLRDLAAARQAAAAEVAAAVAQLAALDSQRQQAQSAAEDASSELRAAQKRRDAAAAAVLTARSAHETAARQAAWQRDQRTRLAAEIETGEADLARAAADLRQLEEQIAAGREAVRAANNALAALTLDEAQAQVAHWQTQVAVAERAHSDAQARRRERAAALERAERTRAGLTTRLRELAESRAAIEAHQTTQRAAESAAAAEIDHLQALIAPAERELEAQEAQITALQRDDSAARSALAAAESRHAQARIQLNRQQEAVDTLRRRVEDDLGLVALEYAAEVSGPTPLPLEGFVAQLPPVEQLAADIEDAISRLRAQLRRMGAVNPEAQAEYLVTKQRVQFLTEQLADLHQAEVDVRQVIGELDQLMHREFRRTFEAVASEFKDIFTRLFGGGAARLVLTDPDNLIDTGIEIEARLPGRRTQGLSLLSGGERSLTAVALVFSLLKISPTPFCVLDEVDAMLDEANVGRFRDLLRELSANTQFMVVTHNRNTVQAADVIYGVTMGRDSASQILSLRLDQVPALVGDDR